MPEAALTLNGRIYRLSCGEDESARLHEVFAIVQANVETAVAEFGQVGEDRLLLLSALRIADEMLENKARLDALETLLAQLQQRSAIVGEE